MPLEFLSDAQIIAADLCSDLSLGLHENEPDSWTPHVGKELAKKLKEKEVKRQEHIYEFILTEKHHCMTLLVMQKVNYRGGNGLTQILMSMFFRFSWMVCKSILI